MLCRTAAFHSDVAARLTELREMLAAAAKTAGYAAGPEVLVASKYFDPQLFLQTVKAAQT